MLAIEQFIHDCPWCDSQCARDAGAHPCSQCHTEHYFEIDTNTSPDMTTQDWENAKALWLTLKQEFDLTEGAQVTVKLTAEEEVEVYY